MTNILTLIVVGLLAGCAGAEYSANLPKMPVKSGGQLAAEDASSASIETESTVVEEDPSNTVEEKKEEPAAEMKVEPVVSMPPADKPPMCGGPGDSCYADAAAMTAKVATTPSGKSLVYVAAGGTFFIWKEAAGSRVLSADGFDQWAKTLNPNGKGFSATDFTTHTLVLGRVCPPNVYLDDINRFMTNKCLYYAADAAQSLAANTGTEGIDFLNAWNSLNGGAQRWFTGNIKACSMKGMRLPTIFETRTTSTNASDYPISDGIPIFAQSAGVPTQDTDGAGFDYTWSATGSGNANSYFIWTDGGGLSRLSYTGTVEVRCVLPSI